MCIRDSPSCCQGRRNLPPTSGTTQWPPQGHTGLLLWDRAVVPEPPAASRLRFPLFLRGVEREAVGEEREGGRDRQAGRRGKERILSRPEAGFDPTTLRIMTQVEIKDQMFNRLSHAGTPGGFTFKGNALTNL